MKRKIDLWEYADQILRQMEKGILITTKADGKVNTMTLGWGSLGVEWKKPIFTAYVRESRYTRELLDKNGEFTVNIPFGTCDRQILGICGTRSGRDMDKIGELGLTLEEPEVICVPAIRELPLTLECRVIYRQLQDPAAISPEDTEKYYPKSPEFPQGDYHIAFCGEIVAAYILE